MALLQAMEAASVRSGARVKEAICNVNGPGCEG
jgi:hypothetical protein